MYIFPPSQGGHGGVGKLQMRIYQMFAEICRNIKEHLQKEYKNPRWGALHPHPAEGRVVDFVNFC